MGNRRLNLRPQISSTTETTRSLKRRKKKKGGKKKKGKKKKKKKTKKPTSKSTSKPTSGPLSGERFSLFRAEYFFAGNKGETIDKKFTKTQDPFFIDYEVGAVVFSGCGVSTTLRITTSIVANKATSDESEIEIGLDSTEVTSPEDEATIKYFVGLLIVDM